MQLAQNKPSTTRLGHQSHGEGSGFEYEERSSEKRIRK